MNRKATFAINKASSKNKESLSNGSLMRCTPMVVWTSNLKNDSVIYKALSIDASFIHPNKLIHSSIFIYTKAIHYLLKNFNDSD